MDAIPIQNWQNRRKQEHPLLLLPKKTSTLSFNLSSRPVR